MGIVVAMVSGGNGPSTKGREGRGWCWGGGSPLTLSQVVPVGAGEKGVAAQALVAQPLPSSAQEALHQIHQGPAGAYLLWELQVPLGVKTRRGGQGASTEERQSQPLFCYYTLVKSPQSTE